MKWGARAESLNADTSVSTLKRYIHVNVLALLWDIKRLRAVVLQADQLQRSLRNAESGAGTILKLLRGQLKDEPCVKESPWRDMGE